MLLYSNIAAQDSLKTKRAFSDVVDFNGYLKFMQSSAFSNDYLLTSSLIHNRLNFKIYANDKFTFKADFRNRMTWGNYVKEVPGFSEGFTADNGLVDLSFTWVNDSSFIFNTTIDRLWAEYHTGKLAVKVGRQRINWGINYVWNPNDLFNAYNYFDFDYEERPGTDAVRIQYFTSGMSAIDIGINPATEAENAVYAAQYRFNIKTYDLQIIGGYFHERITGGGGFAGNLWNSAIKGEMTYFGANDTADASFSAAFDYQYGFKNGINLLFSYLYNSAGSNSFTTNGQTSIFFAEPAANNLMPSKNTLFGDISYTFNPLFTGDLGSMYTFGFDIVYIMPNLTFSLMENLDLNLLAQLFVAMKEIDGSTASLNYVYIRFKWSF
jgi:hypothetical protein